MHSYRAAVEYLFRLQQFGIKLGLNNTRALLRWWGRPEQAYPVVHVAGTNGKGSTCAFIASILAEAGYRVGLYTSPHLVDFRERIRVDGKPIPRTAVLEYTRALRPLVDARRATFFEATTVMAFRYFADAGVDVAIIETGLGGRLDATNVVHPLVNVITGIALDHAEHLGGTVEAIAREKAGIIKRGVPVVIGAMTAPARKVIADAARRKGAPLRESPAEVTLLTIRDFDRMDFTHTHSGVPMRFRSPLAGVHQAANAALALTVAEILAERGVPLSPHHARLGIAGVKRRTGIAARLERLSKAPEIIVDVAHNPDGIRTALATWTSLRPPERTHLVFGLGRAKDLDGVLACIRRWPWLSIRAVDCDATEIRPARGIAARAVQLGVKVMEGGDVVTGMAEAAESLPDDEHILLLGSHFIVGAWLARMQETCLPPAVP
ncbi:MAG: folylpolyglutamate synthase/dihydrofolate synthase family protein [Bacteroidota bacterium]|nr:folylpolyglutamate synthase/dihydrofolate synthase family protein [Bacteroidota bacterium]